jgi:hypothetical protein
LAYPSVGTPFMDHHAVIFSIASGIFIFLAFLKDKPIFWFLVPIFLFASFLSKQIPSAYLLLLFILSILIFWIFFKTKSYKFLVYISLGSILSLFIFILFILINKIPLNSFLIQYIFYPLEIGKDRSLSISYNFNNVFSQFKFIYFSMIPLIFVFFELAKNKFNLETKKDYFLLIFTLLMVSIFILGQIITKNQILIFFLIPFLIGVSHFFCNKYFNKKFILIFLISILIISTIKFHLRFNENKKFMELNNIDLKLAVKAENFDKSLKGLKWITPYNINPDKEIKNLIEIKEIILSDNTKKIIITDYQIFPSVLKLKNIAPNKWFDSMSVPRRNNKYFDNYKNFFIESLRVQKIKTLFIHKDKEKYLKNIFKKDCYKKENINKELSKITIEKCIK